MKLKNSKNMYFIISIITLLIVSFLIYNFVGKADQYANKVAMNKVKITGITTGSGNFTTDGLNYNDASSYTKVTGYTAGNDENDKNRLVRSFDTLTYHFDFSIKGKSDSNDYEERNVNIKVTLPDSISKYVTFDPNSTSTENTHVYTFDGIDTYGSFERDITLYVLGAPNGTEITPSFEIQESSNTDGSYVVNLGKTDSVINYEYNGDNNSYSTTSSVQGFSNYMPTVVSSKTANVRFNLISQSNDGQKATYNDKTGRYLTYVLGVEIVGDANGIKGNTMPNMEDITFSINSSQNGSVNKGIIENSWVRNYTDEVVSSIEPVRVALPYSGGSVDASRKIKNSGTITLNGSSASISGYNLTYNSVNMNADNSSLPNSEYVIGTYAITVFSERGITDSRNDITNTLNISNIQINDTANNPISVPSVSATKNNKYYEVSDYSVSTEFLDEGYNKLSEAKGKSSTSKGTTTILRTTFNYNKTLSDQGLKEIIKIDPSAFRFVPINNKDLNIKIEVPEGFSLSEDDLEIKYVTGDFKNTNYTVSSIDTRLAQEDLSLATSTCPSNISNLSSDQIMNLYGGPCIKANNSELIFDSLSSAKTEDNKEVPITKIIIQTKKGIKLPDSVRITVDAGVRVRNVSDITRTYQATVLASSSDHDDVLTYYSPRITNDENSITNPNNYKKTTYAGNDVSSIDDSSWGDTLKIVNFTSRQVVTVTNKNKDGSMKLNYNANNGTTINYNVKTVINDNNEQVGADDVWYINKLKVYVTLPKELTYIPDKALGTPEVVSENDGSTTLIYTLAYTKPNMKISDINFKAMLKPTIKGSKVEVTVTSRAEAININGERDTSYFDLLNGKLTIYATGIDNVIVTQKVGEEGSVIEKNGQFSYILSAYNNTNNTIDDYTLLDILPSNSDTNGSKFSGDYKVKVVIPNSQSSAKVYCSTKDYSKLTNEVLDSNNDFEECNITSEYKKVTAIKIEKLKFEENKNQMDDIKLLVKTSNNEYEDKYINKFVGGSRTYSQNESNEVEVRVVSRNISGRVFIDNNENGIEEDGDSYLKNIPISLYKLDSNNNLTKIEDTTSNEKGEYKFKNLDVGRYKVRANYNKDIYDVTLRYATSDTAVDSDAYKIEEGLIEISNKRTPSETDGIRLTREIESASNMNIGLISRKTFGFEIDKFITKVDLTYNNTLETHEYLNQKIVKEDVRSSLKAYAKVYYGVKIQNNSTAAGYIKLINENIPQGAVFDEKDPINEGWFYANGQLQNISLADDLIEPGETRYLTIALNIPPQTEYKTYVNTVTLLDIEQNLPEALSEDTNADSNLYNVGEAVTYSGIDWHVIGIESISDTEQHVTLLADSQESNERMGHTNSTNATYKWSESLINKYLSSSYISSSNLNPSILIDAYVCDDASGMPVASYGGTLKAKGTCQSNVYNPYKIRLLTEDEYISLSNLTDKSWLYGNRDFWLQNSVYVTNDNNVYGQTKDYTIVKNLAKYSSKADTSIKTGYDQNISNWVRSTAEKEVRPVITISNKNIIAE